ncbi:hypothetical protein [Nakamurella deserti]|uniref:hypothetical protein n=1 Tax=Nakamurella deserti TaxID=2164074 RepID=UPI000DBE4C23|nr:hypothetical protein [Nakamurella deserti]
MSHRAQIAVTRVTLTLLAGLTALGTRTADDRDDRDRDGDRGDVPGWVMITLMTAIVVVGLLAVFRGQVTDAVKTAFDSIK